MRRVSRNSLGVSMALMVTIVAVLLVIGVVFAYSTKDKNSKQTDDQSMEKMGNDSDSMTDENMKGDDAVMDGAMEEDKMMDEGTVMMDESDAQTFDIDASNFKYSLAEIRVKKGEKVVVNLNITEGFHDWVINEFDAHTSQAGEGNKVSVEFVADKVGTFEYYCSVGNHRAMGMVGKLIVE